MGGNGDAIRQGGVGLAWVVDGLRPEVSPVAFFPALFLFLATVQRWIEY